MPKPFRSLASIFAQRGDEAASDERAPNPLLLRNLEAGVAPAAVAAPPVGAGTHAAPDPRVSDLLDAFVAELARLRARAAERFEEQAEAVLAGLARRVLARELATAPPEIENLLAEALLEFGSNPGVVVRVCASDAERLGARWPVEAEPGLGAGDFAVEIDDGRYDAALQTRLDALLALHRVAL